MEKIKLKNVKEKKNYVTPIMELFIVNTHAGLSAHVSATGELFELEDGGDL